MARLVVSNAKSSFGRDMSGVQHASRGLQAARHWPSRVRQGSFIGRGREVSEHKAHSSRHSYSFVLHARTQATAGDMSADGRQENTNGKGSSPGDAQADAAKQKRSRGDPEQGQARPTAQTMWCQVHEPAKQPRPRIFVSLLLTLLILVKVFVHVCKMFVRMTTMAIASFICPRIDRKQNL